MQGDRERWNRRFADNGKAIRPTGEPELETAGHNLHRKGLALELACGRGANALYLARAGYDVVALDIAINGLRACRREARRRDLRVYPVVMDLDSLVLPNARFDLVSVVRYLNRGLFPVLVEALAPGGLLFYKTFNQRHLVDNPDFNPDYVLADGELAAAFSGLEPVLLDESGNSSVILARAPG
jgi:SAM-dependent methyltransferase